MTEGFVDMKDKITMEEVNIMLLNGCPLKVHTPCEQCDSSGWEDKVHRPVTGVTPKCGSCKICKGTGWKEG